MNWAIHTHELSKTFNSGAKGIAAGNAKGRVVAVSGLNLRVPYGAVYGLIGRNGAGKTTTLRLLMGLLRPDHGWAHLLSHDLWVASRNIRQKIAYVSQLQQLPGWMTLSDLCLQHAFYYPNWDKDFADRIIRQWELPAERMISQLSGGEQRQAAIVLALAARPELLLLDEPAAGLDPVARRALLNGIVEILAQACNCTVLFSTHIISDLERVADCIGIMDRGRLMMSTKLSELIERIKKVQVVFDQTRPPSDFSIPGAIRRQDTGPVVTALVNVCADSQLNSIREIPGVRVNVFPVSLEEIFIEMFSNTSKTRFGDELGVLWSAGNGPEDVVENYEFNSQQIKIYEN